MYQFNDAEGTLKQVTPNWANEVFWIGDEFFESVGFIEVDEFNNTLDSEKIERKQLVKREYSTLVRKYGKHFEQKLKYHDGFCNLPAHFNYQQVVRNFYNRYAPFIHTPEEGSYEATLAFLKHIFGTRIIEHNGQSIAQFELGLDYIQLLLTEPTQKLPVLILFSKENNTGKSLLASGSNTSSNKMRSSSIISCLRVSSTNFGRINCSLFAKRLYLKNLLQPKKSKPFRRRVKYPSILKVKNSII